MSRRWHSIPVTLSRGRKGLDASEAHELRATKIWARVTAPNGFEARVNG
jgi:hypothetical protein